MELHLTATECHLPYGSHSVTYHPTQVNTLRFNHSQKAGTRFTYTTDGWEAKLTKVTCYIPRWFTRLQTHRSTNRAQ